MSPLIETGEIISRTFSVAAETEISTVAWNPEGDILAAARSDGVIDLWEFNAANLSASHLGTLQEHEGWINELAWSQDGRLASAGEDLLIYIWNVQTLEREKALFGEHDSPIMGMSWGPNGQLASIDGNPQIVIWNVEQEKKTTLLSAPYRGPITSVSWSPDGTKLAFGGNSYNVYVYNTLYVQSPCSWLTRNMTIYEWETYFPGEPYHATCPELPTGIVGEEADIYQVLDEGFEAGIAGDIATAVEKFDEAEAQGLEIGAWDWNDLCWLGGIYNQAELSYFACERAVELEPDNGEFHDARGISRALLGDFEGAIVDFEIFVVYAREFDFPEDMIALREQWIEALQLGNNPFDEATLAFLRRE
ncbi:MAG: hypothetical protein HC806_10160 [Anaerolineae bacterium]|nr:hypothetical protein [Anaerolineae bacterium]